MCTKIYVERSGGAEYQTIGEAERSWSGPLRSLRSAPLKTRSTTPLILNPELSCYLCQKYYIILYKETPFSQKQMSHNLNYEMEPGLTAMDLAKASQELFQKQRERVVKL